MLQRHTYVTLSASVLNDRTVNTRFMEVSEMLKAFFYETPFCLLVNNSVKNEVNLKIDESPNIINLFLI